MRGMYLVLCLCLALAIIPPARADTLDGALAQNEVIRLHVIANSDDAFDQAVKLFVRDAVLTAYAPALTGATYAEALDSLRALLAQIEACARQAATQAGYTGQVRALLETRAFPTREYDGVRVPAGEYMALCIELGQAEGRNWWCVMYPPLCLTAPTLSHAEQMAA